MEDEYEEENFLENVDDEDEEMVNENFKGGRKNTDSKNGDGEKGMGPPNITFKPPGTKQKRRSKNDCNGRDYVCGCGKTYLSYPALYTHIKTKHNGNTPEGTNANQVQNGRGRGRPRKNFLINEEEVKRGRLIRNEESLEERHEFKDLFNKKDRYENEDGERNEIYINIYKGLGLLGGPTDPYEGFPQTYENIKNKIKVGYEPIFNKLKYIMENNLVEILLNNNNPEVISDDSRISSITTSSSIQDSKIKLTCDDIFALFLIENSKILKAKFYKTLVIFIKLYRDCMNKVGWETLSQYKNLSYELTSSDYTSIKNGELLPEIANDFVNLYLPNNLPVFDLHIATVLVNHFCDWLYKFNFTHIKLKFINEEDRYKD